MQASTKNAEAVKQLQEAGAVLVKAEDRHGDTRTGWWLDGVWLAPKSNPVAALEAIRG